MAAVWATRKRALDERVTAREEAERREEKGERKLAGPVQRRVGTEYYVGRKLQKVGVRAREKYYRAEVEIWSDITSAKVTYGGENWAIADGVVLARFLDVVGDDALPLVVVTETALRRAREEKGR